jgi:hypothetical protein
MFPPQIQRIRIGRRTISPCQTRIAERSYRTPLGTVTRVKIPPVHKEVIRHWMVAQMSLTGHLRSEAVPRAPRAGGDHCSKNV